MTEKLTAAQARKHDRYQARLIGTLNFFQKIGYSDETISVIVSSMMAFNRQWDSWQKNPPEEPMQAELPGPMVASNSDRERSHTHEDERDDNATTQPMGPS